MKMSDEEDDWSIDDLRTSHECDEHWMLRRQFLLRNKGKYPKIRLLSLSQVFCNMEFLGCRYPDETMALVSQLSEGIVDEYREKQSGRLQRTFIKASSAAEAKSKDGLWAVGGRGNNAVVKLVNGIKLKKSLAKLTTVSIPVSSASIRHFSQMASSQELFLPSDPPLQIIHRSSQMSGKLFSFTYINMSDRQIGCTFQLGAGCFVASGIGSSKDAAKQAAASAAVEALQKICHTIQIKQHVVSAAVGISVRELKDQSEPAAIGDDNVGSKLLKLMGWTGGALGKNETGIQDPLDTSSHVVIGRSRFGIGYSASSDLSGKETFTAKQVESFLTKEFQNQSNCNKEIVFSSEFSKVEREVIHRTAHRLHLKSKSYGRVENRSLVISQKATLPALLQQLILEGESDKYRVLLPSNMTTTPQP